MEKQSLLFLGSKPIGYHCLYYLIQQLENLHLTLSGVLTNDKAGVPSPTNVRHLAYINNIPVFETPEDMPSADFIYSVQYHRILKKEDIQKARKLALNLHMAPLPEYRGCNQFSYAIIERKKEFGTTIHIMDAHIDHGDILFERRFPIPENCWVTELYELTFNASIDLFIETLPRILQGDIQPSPQETLIPLRGSTLHYRKEIEDLKKIDLQWDSETIERHIRATYMPGFELPYAMIENTKIYFTKA